jgi:aspartate-semialdehyde dehydrogenase
MQNRSSSGLPKGFNMRKLWNVAVVGATGIGGRQIVECLEEREFPVGTIKFLGSSRSAGEAVEFKGQPVAAAEIDDDSFAGIDIAFFAAGSDAAREYCPAAALAGAVCIDTSGAWRMDPKVPLVIPNVNPEAISRYTGSGIIAVPNSAVIQLVTALKPLHDRAVIRRAVISTYQSVSGTGSMAVKELERQIRSLFNGKPVEAKVYPHQIAFNCIPQVDAFTGNGYTREEMKLINETGKIIGGDMRITATAVRVPVFYGHSAAVSVETERKITAEDARDLLRNAPGCRLVDDPAERDYPMPVDAAGDDDVLVGRIREDFSCENGLNLWVVADNVRIGAADAVQVAEILVTKYLK